YSLYDDMYATQGYVGSTLKSPMSRSCSVGKCLNWSRHNTSLPLVAGDGGGEQLVEETMFTRHTVRERRIQVQWWGGGVARVWTTTYARKVWDAETFHSNSNDVMASAVNPSSLFDLAKKTVDEQFSNNGRAIMSLKGTTYSRRA
ncbi:hypothetical protein J6590_098163, partial [Homalodisca vitripennis]